MTHGPIFTTLMPVWPTGRPCSIWQAISQLWQPEHHCASTSKPYFAIVYSPS